MNENWVIVFVHKGETTQLPKPPKPQKKKKWVKRVVRFVALYLIEKSITSIL